MSRVRVQIMNQFHRKSHEYKAIKRYWKLIQQDSRKLSDKRFYRPTFRMHLTNKEILNKLLSYSEDLKHHYQLYQLLLFHFQNKEPEKFFGLIEDNLKQVHPLFQTVFKTFLKDKKKIVNALQLPYSNAKLEATNNLIKLIKRNAFGFRNFENFKKRIFIAKIITMDMFSPYYDLAKQLRFQISRLRLKQSPRLFHSRMLKSFLIAFTLYNILAVL
ncbi:transposase [Streptococcus pneumoniae]|nr:transposase [Streptococcus pneumoniae]